MQMTKKRSGNDAAKLKSFIGAANLEPETIAVHAGERDKKRQHRSVTAPIDQAAAYYFEDTRQIADFYEGRLEGVKYGRYGCPTQHAVEEKMAGLEGADRALSFSSGMNALTTTVLALAGKGQHIVFTGDCYRNSRRFFTDVLPRFGIESTEIDIDKTRQLGNHFKSNTVLFFSETPTNPFLRLIDMAAVCETARKNGVISVIDSTFATPLNLRPIDYGADIVLHSATKYLAGHHDLFAGVVAGDDSLISKIQQYRDIFGGLIAPNSAYLLLRSLQTLPLRMEVHNRNGLALACYLENHPKVEKIWYPGCASHPDYELAQVQMRGFGGVITFALKACESETSRFVDALKIPYIATNFGGPQSLIEQHAILTFYKDREQAEKRWISGNLLRYSVGFEHPNDVIADFEHAFSSI